MAKVNLGRIVGPAGADGQPGRGIDRIEKTATAGLVDIYTIFYTDGTTSTYTVTNGSGGGAGGAFIYNLNAMSYINDPDDMIEELGDIEPVQSWNEVLAAITSKTPIYADLNITSPNYYLEKITNVNSSGIDSDGSVEIPSASEQGAYSIIDLENLEEDDTFTTTITTRSNNAGFETDNRLIIDKISNLIIDRIYYTEKGTEYDLSVYDDDSEYWYTENFRVGENSNMPAVTIEYMVTGDINYGEIKVGYQRIDYKGSFSYPYRNDNEPEIAHLEINMPVKVFNLPGDRGNEYILFADIMNGASLVCTEEECYIDDDSKEIEEIEERLNEVYNSSKPIKITVNANGDPKSESNISIEWYSILHRLYREEDKDGYQLFTDNPDVTCSIELWDYSGNSKKINTFYGFMDLTNVDLPWQSYDSEEIIAKLKEAKFVGQNGSQVITIKPTKSLKLNGQDVSTPYEPEYYDNLSTKDMTTATVTYQSGEWIFNRPFSDIFNAETKRNGVVLTVVNSHDYDSNIGYEMLYSDKEGYWYAHPIDFEMKLKFDDDRRFAGAHEYTQEYGDKDPQYLTWVSRMEITVNKQYSWEVKDLADTPVVSVIMNLTTNLNGFHLQTFEASEKRYDGGYPYYLITRNSHYLNKKDASEYLSYMTGSGFVPEYNYQKPAYTLMIDANMKMYKPQFNENSDGLRLYEIPTSITPGPSADFSIKVIDASDSSQWDPSEGKPTDASIRDILNHKYDLVKIEGIDITGDGSAVFDLNLQLVYSVEAGSQKAREYMRFDEGDEDEGDPANIESFLFINDDKSPEDVNMIVRNYEFGGASGAGILYKEIYKDGNNEFSLDLEEVSNAIDEGKEIVLKMSSNGNEYINYYRINNIPNLGKVWISDLNESYWLPVFTCTNPDGRVYKAIFDRVSSGECIWRIEDGAIKIIPDYVDISNNTITLNTDDLNSIWNYQYKNISVRIGDGSWYSFHATDKKYDALERLSLNYITDIIVDHYDDVSSLKILSIKLYEDSGNLVSAIYEDYLNPGSTPPAPRPPEYNMNYYLNNATLSYQPDTIEEGASYHATISTESGFSVLNVRVEMNYEDITKTSLDVTNGIIDILSATGPISITISATSNNVYSITNNLTNVNSTSYGEIAVEQNGRYTAHLYPDNEFYDINSVNITMGGVDITNEALQSDYDIEIDSVTGDVIITASASQGTRYFYYNIDEHSNLSYQPSSINAGENYQASVSFDSGYTLDMITIYNNTTSEDVTYLYYNYSTNEIYIPALNFDVSINISSTEESQPQAAINYYNDEHSWFSDTPDYVNIGDSFQTTVYYDEKSGYRLDKVNIYMNEADITGEAFDYNTNEITINNVTSDVNIYVSTYYK